MWSPLRRPVGFDTRDGLIEKLTTLQLDRPGAELVTDREAVDFAGAGAPGSTCVLLFRRQPRGHAEGLVPL